MKGIGILPSARHSYIDHLVPLCQIMDIPLLVTDLKSLELIEKYYPPMDVRYFEPEDYCLDEALSDFDTFFYVDPFRLPHGNFLFGDYLSRRKARSVYCMHGNSDKKRNAFWIEQLADEDIILLYGPQTVEFLKSKGVEKPYIHSGNYRLEYYKNHLSFFQKKLSLQKDKTTILYAPTWIAHNKKTEWRYDYSSFFEAHSFIFENIPDEFELIVKMHPLYSRLMQEQMQEVQTRFPNIRFLEDCPLIYPLLKNVDIYLGDYSSIGYDFLYFQKPMFFLNFSTPTILEKCGISLKKRDLSRLYSILFQNRENKFSGIQEELYNQAFGEKKELGRLKQEIQNACAST